MSKGVKILKSNMSMINEHGIKQNSNPEIRSLL